MDSCAVKDAACVARNGFRQVARVRCHACGADACLSCSVRIPLSQREAWVCHACAERLNPEAVRRHRSLLAPGGVTMDKSRAGPMVAPQPPVTSAAAWTGGARRGWRRDVALAAPIKRQAEDAPAKPKPYPKRRMEILGYAR